jgi:hypothetical protein
MNMQITATGSPLGLRTQLPADLGGDPGTVGASSHLGQLP